MSSTATGRASPSPDAGAVFLYNGIIMRRQQGFTLVELLVAIGIVGVLSVVIFFAIDPAERFAQARNKTRWSDVMAILDAARFYTIDNLGEEVPGVDGTLRMLGTASSGCEVTCNAVEVASIPFPQRVELAAYDRLDAHNANAQSTGGWISPTIATDAAGQWTNESNAHDGDTGTYATNTYGSSGWGQFIELELATPITSDRLRVMADYLNAHITEVDVDVFVDGAWEDVFTGGDESTWNVQWVTLTFTSGTVEKMRFRWNYAVSGFYYWLFDVQFYESLASPNAPTCGTQSASSVTASTAVLNAEIGDDGGGVVEYQFEYGLTDTYGSSTSWSGSYVTGESVFENISGLSGNTTYHYRTRIRNGGGTTNCADQTFTTASGTSGWGSPSGSTGSWSNAENAYDGSTTSFARLYHNIGDPQWSDYLTLNVGDLYYDELRFYALSGSEVSDVDIDLYYDGGWNDLYEGSFADRSWETISFSEEYVEQVRIRFYATNANHGFFWELNELQLYQTASSESLEPTAEGCLDLSSDLSEYLVEMPIDPVMGTQQRTYYAIRQDYGTQKLTVLACAAEDGEVIGAAK